MQLTLLSSKLTTCCRCCPLELCFIGFRITQDSWPTDRTRYSICNPEYQQRLDKSLSLFPVKLEYYWSTPVTVTRTLVQLLAFCFIFDEIENKNTNQWMKNSSFFSSTFHSSVFLSSFMFFCTWLKWILLCHSKPQFIFIRFPAFRTTISTGCF